MPCPGAHFGMPPHETLAEVGFGHRVVPLDALDALEAASRESRAPTAATVPPRRRLPTWSSSWCRRRVLAALAAPGYPASGVVIGSAPGTADTADCAACAPFCLTTSAELLLLSGDIAARSHWQRRSFCYDAVLDLPALRALSRPCGMRALRSAERRGGERRVTSCC